MQERKIVLLITILSAAVLISCNNNVFIDEECNHCFSTKWIFDKTNHWRECDECHAKKYVNAHNSNIQYIDDRYHCFECDICHFKTEKEEHTWGSDCKCTVCGYSKPQTGAGSGTFSVNINCGPIGVLFAHEEKESNGWIITLTDINKNNPIYQINWKVEGSVLFEYENQNICYFIPPYDRPYTVMCEISDKSGVTTTLFIDVNR